MREQDVVCRISDNLKPISAAMKDKMISYHKSDLLKGWNGLAKRRTTSKYMFSVWSYTGDYQICRNFECHIDWHNRRKDMDVVLFCEVSRWFINLRTMKEHNIMLPYYWACRGFSYGRRMIYKNRLGDFSSYVANIEGIPVSCRLHPLLRRNGLKVEMMMRAQQDFKVKVWNDRRVIRRIMTSPFYETLIKSRLWRLTCMEDWKVNEAAIKLLIRNNINLEQDEVRVFKDAIELMTRYNVDWHNGKILRDWRRWHDVCVNRRHRDMEREELKKGEALFNDPDICATFLQTHKAYIGLAFVEGDFVYTVLSSVRDYYDEGVAMKHCVFANKYYEDPNSVIFSIRDLNNKRIATLEYDSEKDEVLQLRGKCNRKPTQYDEILSNFFKNRKKWNIA